MNAHPTCTHSSNKQSNYLYMCLRTRAGACERERYWCVWLEKSKKFNVVFQLQRLKTARLIVLGWLIFRGMPTGVPWRRHLCCMSTPVHDHTHTHIRTRTRTHVQYKHTLKHYLLRANYMSNRVIAATLQTQIRTFKHTVQTTVFIGPVGYLSISVL